MGLAHTCPIMVKLTFIQLSCHSITFQSVGVIHASLVSCALLPSLISICIGVEFDDVSVCSTLEGTSKVVRGPFQLIVCMSSCRVDSYTLGELNLGYNTDVALSAVCIHNM